MKDIGIAKNYLQENELKILNNLVSGYFDLAEINTIEHKQAIGKEKAEYRKYQENTLTPVEQAYLESIKDVAKEVKKKNYWKRWCIRAGRWSGMYANGI